MPHTVITIARTLGSLGEDVGRAVAQQLGYRYADSEIISAAADKAGVSRDAIAAAEHRPGLVARILESMSGMSIEPQAYYGQALTMPVSVPAAGYDDVIRDVIIETAAPGKVVIVAHGAGICLANTPGVLRVLIDATPSVREERVAAGASVDASKAKKAVGDSDKDREDFLRRFYDVRHESAWHYDLVLNTDRLSVAQAASLVVTAASG